MEEFNLYFPCMQLLMMNITFFCVGFIANCDKWISTNITGAPTDENSPFSNFFFLIFFVEVGQKLLQVGQKLKHSVKHDLFGWNLVL